MKKGFTMKFEYRNLAKIFNSNVLSSIAQGDISYINKIASDFFDAERQVTLAEFYELAYKSLTKNYANEYVYKNLIAQKILIGRHSLNTATMLSEFRVGVNKADCVILNGKSTCYEIKTDYDSLTRLEDQLAAYMKIFDEVYVVCSLKHLKNVEASIDTRVGILILSDRLSFKQHRKAIRLGYRKNEKLMMQALRKPEYLEIAEALAGEKIIVPNTQLFSTCLNVFISTDDYLFLNKLFLKTLKKTRKNKAEYIRKLPYYLTNAMISYNFDKLELNSLINKFKSEEKIHVLPNSTRKT